MYKRQDINLSEYVVQGQQGEFSITITNHGPDDAGVDSLNNLPIFADSSIIQQRPNGIVDIWFAKDLSQAQECFFVPTIFEPLPIPGSLPSYAFTFAYPVIPVGESITCYGFYSVGFEQGERAVQWDIFNSTDTDPNLLNNSVDLVFRMQPMMIPSTSTFSLIILTICIFFSFSSIKQKLLNSPN